MAAEEGVKLTDKQERFCYEYCVDFNATQAAIRAGYSESSAKEIGCENLTKPNIKKRIDYHKSHLAEMTGISAYRIAKEHEKIAFSDISMIFNDWIEQKEFDSLPDNVKACIQQIEHKTEHRVEKTFSPLQGEFVESPVEVKFIKVKLYDKQKSLESLSKMLGHDAPSKLELTGKDGAPLIQPISRDTAKRIIESL